MTSPAASLILLCLALGASASCARERTYEDEPDAYDATTPRACAVIAEDYELFVHDTVRPGVLTRRGASQRTREISGTVSEQTSVVLADSMGTNGPRPEHPDEIRILRIEEGARAWTISVVNLTSFGLRDGAEVTAQFHYESDGVAPPTMLLTLRSAGTLAFVYALGAAVTSLDLPAELSAERGPASCSGQSECGSWSEHPLRVRDTASGATTELSSGEHKTLGAFQLIGAESQQLPDTTSACKDWFPSRAQLIAYRRAPL